MKASKLVVALVSGVSMLGATAHAATETGTMGVSATVSRTCTVTAAPLAFGNLNTAANTDASANISVTCTAGSSTDAPSVTFGAGANAASNQRQMIGGDSGTALIPYGLYANTARTTDLLSTAPVSATTSNNGVNYSVTVYGRVPAGTYEMGNFNDSVTVTLTYQPQ